MTAYRIHGALIAPVPGRRNAFSRVPVSTIAEGQGTRAAIKEARGRFPAGWTRQDGQEIVSPVLEIVGINRVPEPPQERKR